jgi:uncharacterized membrane protein YfcA
LTETLIALIACAGFVVEAGMGFGATVVVVSLAAQLLPIDQVLPAFVPVNLVLSTVIVLRQRRHIAWRTLGNVVAPPVAAGLVAGILAFDALHEWRWLPILFAAFVALLALVELLRRAPASSLPAWLRVILLTIGGVVHGLFGAGGPMLVYVGARLWPDKAAFRASLSTVWLAANSVLVVNFVRLHLYSQKTAFLGGAIAAGVIPALIAGEWLHRRLEGPRFARAVWLALLIAATALLVRSVA